MSALRSELGSIRPSPPQHAGDLFERERGVDAVGTTRDERGDHQIEMRVGWKVFERLLEKALSRDQVASGSHVEGTTAREAKDLIRELRRTNSHLDARCKEESAGPSCGSSDPDHQL